MIAALASGVLGQLEGMGSLSSGISGVSALLDQQSDGTGASIGQDLPSAGKMPHHGRGGGGSALSSQMQNLLLQQQEQSDLPPAQQVDQVVQSVSVG